MGNLNTNSPILECVYGDTEKNISANMNMLDGASKIKSLSLSGNELSISLTEQNWGVLSVASMFRKIRVNMQHC